MKTLYGILEQVCVMSGPTGKLFHWRLKNADFSHNSLGGFTLTGKCGIYFVSGNS